MQKTKKNKHIWQSQIQCAHSVFFSPFLVEPTEAENYEKLSSCADDGEGARRDGKRRFMVWNGTASDVVFTTCLIRLLSDLSSSTIENELAFLFVFILFKSLFTLEEQSSIIPHLNNNYLYLLC